MCEHIVPAACSGRAAAAFDNRGLSYGILRERKGGTDALEDTGDN